MAVVIQTNNAAAAGGGDGGKGMRNKAIAAFGGGDGGEGVGSEAGAAAGAATAARVWKPSQQSLVASGGTSVQPACPVKLAL